MGDRPQRARKLPSRFQDFETSLMFETEPRDASPSPSVSSSDSSSDPGFGPVDPVYRSSSSSEGTASRSPSPVKRLSMGGKKRKGAMKRSSSFEDSASRSPSPARRLSKGRKKGKGSMKRPPGWKNGVQGKSEMQEEGEEDKIERKPCLRRVPGKKEHMVHVCFVCSRGFTSIEQLQEHIDIGHVMVEMKGNFKCGYCLKAFVKKYLMKRHEERHFVPNFACDKCPAVYCKKDTLERHYSDKHGCRMDGTRIVKKKLSCETCGKKFGVEKELQYHKYYCSRKEEITEKRAEKKEEEKMKFAADVVPCDRKTKIAKDKSCPVCGDTLSSMQSRNRHVLRKHPGHARAVLAALDHYAPSQEQLAARPYSCTICGKALANRAALSIHQRRQHGANDRKMYDCDKCGKRYPLQSELRKHVKRNEGRKMCRERGGRGGRIASRVLDVKIEVKEEEEDGEEMMMKQEEEEPIASETGAAGAASAADAFDSKEGVKEEGLWAFAEDEGMATDKEEEEVRVKEEPIDDWW